MVGKVRDTERVLSQLTGGYPDTDEISVTPLIVCVTSGVILGVVSGVINCGNSEASAANGSARIELAQAPKERQEND